MAGPLLETKIHVPRRRAGQVARPRLLERLDRAAGASAVLVSAPAGFGKTTLVAQWVADRPGSVAWLSLDGRDDEPSTFWRYVVAALRTVAPGVGSDALAQLEQPHGSLEGALSSLLNDLAALDEDVVLVLDDVHLIESPEIHEGMTFLLEHLPARLQLVLASRADPMLPLARLRARGELAEVRAADLRFTDAEASAYLTEAMGLPLSEQDVSTLERRTEGWIAALQLAALSLRDRPDAQAFIADFAGDDRYIVDFLVEEVLQRQTQDVRGFLLHTAVLASLSGPLCDAVTGRDDSRALLEHLDRANLFVVPLDDQRRSYRYHHLFGEVLRARLLDEQPDLVPELHRRASRWYEQGGDRREAVRHALAGADTERAAHLIELELTGLQRDRQEATLRAWIDALPDDVLRARPVLTIAFVGSRLVRGELGGVEEKLQDAERWVAACGDDDARTRPAGMVVVDEERFRAVPGGIAIYRAAQARLRGDVPATVRHARRALDLVAAGDSVERGAASALLALASWTTGDLLTAQRCYAEAMGVFERIGYRSDVAGCAIAAADILLVQGRLRAARDVVEHALGLTLPSGGPPLRGAGDMHVAMSEVLREQGDLDGALERLTASRELGEHLGLPQNPYRWRVAAARLRCAEGDLEGALGLLEEAERVYVGDFSPDVRPVAATRARVLLAAGDLDGALAWARRRELSPDDEVTYLREYEHVTLARILLHRHAAERSARHLTVATSLLTRLRTAALDGGRHGTALELTILMSLARRAAGDRAGAVATLREAVTAGEPEGYVRLFADEGAGLLPLLRELEAGKAGVPQDYVHRLLAACAGELAPPAASGVVPSPGGERLVDPLSERELQVLRLLAGDLDGPGIARELVVSVHTVRTHTKNIYAKLGVNSRRAAVRRAVELHLMPGANRV